MLQEPLLSQNDKQTSLFVEMERVSAAQTAENDTDRAQSIRNTVNFPKEYRNVSEIKKYLKNNVPEIGLMFILSYLSHPIRLFGNISAILLQAFLFYRRDSNETWNLVEYGWLHLKKNITKKFLFAMLFC